MTVCLYHDELKNVLEGPTKQLRTSYEKGALINMALDISLQDFSNGEKACSGC